jgi:excisionase family DNA binding protein
MTVPRPTIKTHGKAVVEAIDQADNKGDPLYTVGEVAATLRMSNDSIRDVVLAGIIPATRVSHANLIRDSDLRAYLKAGGFGRWRVP